MENALAAGGFGSAVEEWLVSRGYQGHIRRFGWPDEFVPHGAHALLLRRYGLTPPAMAESIATLAQPRA